MVARFVRFLVALVCAMSLLHVPASASAASHDVPAASQLLDLAHCHPVHGAGRMKSTDCMGTQTCCAALATADTALPMLFFLPAVPASVGSVLVLGRKVSPLFEPPRATL